MDLGLAGKVALVTGGSRGIGRAIALRLAAEGAHVAICGRTSETLDTAGAELERTGVRTHLVVADVTCPGEVERFVDDSAAALGGAVRAIRAAVPHMRERGGGSAQGRPSAF